MKLGMTRRRWPVIGATLLLAGGSSAWALTRPSAATSASATTSLVAAATGTLQQTVSTSGTIQPAQQAVLAFSVPGTVTSVPVSVGQKVTKGAVLATVDPTSLETLVTTATAGVTAAEQQLASVSTAASAQVTAAQAQLAAARSTLTQAEANLAAASLTAPFSGVVAAVGINVGDVEASSGGSRSGAGSSAAGGGSGTTSTSSPGSITLITTNAWVVNASVGSADLAVLQKGLQATVSPVGGSMVFGTIASIGIVATSSTGGTAMFPIVVDITGSPGGLYAGATADVSLIVKQIQNALTVPTSAIQTVNGSTVVYLHRGTARIATPVVVGASYGPTTQILKGLKVGDQVEVPLGRGRGPRRAGSGTGGGGFGGAGGGFGAGGGAAGGGG